MVLVAPVLCIFQNFGYLEWMLDSESTLIFISLLDLKKIFQYLRVCVWGGDWSNVEFGCELCTVTTIL